MARMRRVLAVTGLVLLVVFIVFGCSLFLKDDINAGGKPGWYIKLNIHGASSSKAITVTDYEVTRLAIEVHDPAGEVIRTIEWKPEDGSTSYVIPVTQQGRYELLVTHVGTKDGKVVEAEESAAFDMQAMIITVIDITPGCIGMIKVEPGNGGDHIGQGNRRHQR